MKKNRKIVHTTLIIVIIISLTTIFLLKNTYCITESLTDKFISDNINELNTILENKLDTTNPYYMTEIVDENGNVPSYQYYNNNQIDSRSIMALEAYDDKIFMGLGDWNKNTGPVKVLYYDTKTGKIGTSGTIDDEAIGAFKIIDGKLYTTGRDPRNGWGYGSYYIYNRESNSWEKHMFNNGWIHVFDIEKYNEKLFMCGSVVASSKKSLVQVSFDNGNTFEDVKVVFSDGNQVPYDSDLRAYSFFTYKEDLYTRIYKGSSDYNGIYKYNEENNEFNFITGIVPLIYPFRVDNSVVNGYPAFEKFLFFETLNFNNDDIYISGKFIFILFDSEKYTLYYQGKKINNDYAIQNGVTNDDTLYLLTCHYNEDMSFNVRIYSTKNLDDYNLIYEFKTDSFPYSIEYFNNSIYIGTTYEEKIKDSSTVGSLYRIDLDKLEKKLTLDKNNKTINITADGNSYSTEYELTPTESIFKITLSFNNNMSQKEWELEFNKFKNLNLLYTITNNRNNINYDNSISYFNDVISNSIDTSSNYSTANEFAKSIFDNGLSIQNKRFNITTEKISDTDEEYKVLITLAVTNIDDTITSDKYIINEEKDYIYIGDTTDTETIKNNINHSEITDINIDFDNNRLLLKIDEELIKEYILIRFNTEKKILNKSIYVGILSDKDILPLFNLTNCNSNIENNKLQIKYNDSILDEYDLIRFSSDKLKTISNDKVYVGSMSKDKIKENINIVNGESIIENDKIKIINNDNTFAEIDILSIDFGDLGEKNKTIIKPEDILYDEFINNITVSSGISVKTIKDETEIVNGNIEEGMLFKVFYNDEEIDSLNIINEYIRFDDKIIIDVENRFLSNIEFNKNALYLLDKIDTTGNVTIMNNNYEIINNNTLIGTGSRVIIKLIKKDYDYLLVVNGDVDGNGTLNLYDIYDIANYLYKDKNKLSGVYLKAADYDGNNTYNLEDIMKAANSLSKLK